MSEPLFSSSWYRIAGLQPRLRKHAQIHRHEYRGEVWHILQNHITGQHFRFNPIVYHIIGLMDGRRTVKELWDLALEAFGDDAPTQDDLVRLLGQLHSADVLICDIPPDTRELFSRGENIRRSKVRQTLLSPLAWRFPLVDPERFLRHLEPFSRFIFSWWSAAVWLAVVLTAAVLGFMHRSELTHDVFDRVLAMDNIALLWVVYPCIKFLHEMGHALAVKRWKGEVHEMGIMLLVFIPVPYVDASSSSSFPKRLQRAMVSGAGILVELFVAALALFLWLAIEPGTLRSALYNAIFIGGVSTLFFNGNPLLRYDGYYILSDILAIPNLAQRGQEYAAYLVKRRIFGLKKTQPPHLSPGEPFWLLFYFVSSFIYRIMVYIAIILFISGKFFFFGIILGIWALLSMAVFPLGKALNFVLFSPALREKRTRAIATVGVPAALLAGFLFAVPFPSWTRVEGVIWVPEESVIRAGAGGFVKEVVAKPGSMLRAGDLILESEDPNLSAERDVLVAELHLLQARYTAEVVSDRLKARLTKEEMIPVQERISWIREQLSGLRVITPVGGKLVLQRDTDLPGRYLQKGEIVGYILQGSRPTVRVVVPQTHVDMIRNRKKSIEVRLARQIGRKFSGTLVRETPAGLDRLPSTALGSAGGGQVTIDPSDEERVKTFERTFQLDLEIPLSLSDVSVNERVYVRFNFEPEPPATQWYRALRRLFMRRFDL